MCFGCAAEEDLVEASAFGGLDSRSLCQEAQFLLGVALAAMLDFGQMCHSWMQRVAQSLLLFVTALSFLDPTKLYSARRQAMGQGLPQNDSAAAQWFGLAAERGSGSRARGL